MRRLALGTALLLAAGTARAQCRPPATSNEARLLTFYEAPILFGTVEAPEPLAPWHVRVSAEMVPVPTPDASQQRTGYCYQAKQEHTRLAAAFGRPRLLLALPAGWALEGSWVPPVTVGRAQPDLASGALSHLTSLGSIGEQSLWLSLRAHGTAGRVRGPITCAADVLQLTDESAPCYGSAPSRDVFHPDMWGLESALSAWRGGGRLGVQLGAGYTWLRPRFQVAFTDATGYSDSTRVAVDLRRATAFGGVTWRPAPPIAIAGTVHVLAHDAATWHVSLGWRPR